MTDSVTQAVVKMFASMEDISAVVEAALVPHGDFEEAGRVVANGLRAYANAHPEDNLGWIVKKAQSAIDAYIFTHLVGEMNERLGFQRGFLP